MRRLPFQWRVLKTGFRREERWSLGLCAAVIMACCGSFHMHHSANATLPPMFVDAPQLSTTKSGARSVRVHLSGAVQRAGVYVLPMGARVAQALEKAGGVTKAGDAHILNLAARVQDGQQIVVADKARSTTASASAIVSATGPVANSDSAPVNINTANAVELETLPGIGPAIAARIMQYRARRRFGSVEDLDAVKGIGAKRIERLRPYITF